MVASLPLALATLALGLWAARRGGHTGERAAGAALGVGGIAFAAIAVLERASAALPASAGLLTLARGAAALALWGALAALAFHRLRRRDLFWVLPFGLFTFLHLLAPAPSVGPGVVLALPVVARQRWVADAGRRMLGPALLGGLAAAVLAFVPVEVAPAARGSVADAAGRYAAWARELAGVFMLLALPALLRRWSLGIRRVSRRLVLLLLLSGLVPLLLIAVLWAVGTVLGAGAERALFAQRLVDGTAAGLREELAAALERAPAEVEPLERVASAHPRWPGLRLWRGEARVHGDSIPQERALAGWPDSLAQQGVVLLADSAWLGARIADSGGPAVALVPASQVFEAGLARAVGARLSLETDFAGDSLAALLRGTGTDSLRGARAESLQAGLVRAGLARTGGGLHLNVGGTPVVSSRRFSAGAGHAVMRGLWWDGAGWGRAASLLTVEVAWQETLAGLFRNVRENPFNILPLFFIGLLLVLVLMLAAVNLGMVRALGRSIMAAVAALRGGAARLESGDLAHRIEVAGDDDLWDVAAAFNRMAEGLERGRRLEAERQRLEDELALARRIQARLLPPGPPRVPGLELHGLSEPARQVGGDYYDFIPVGDGRVALVIADVSGKGVPAALLMSAFRASLLSQLAPGAESGPVMSRINAFLHRSVEPGRFVTAFLALVDPRDGRVSFTNAGHNPPMLVRRSGAVERLEAGGLLLGMLEDAPFETGAATLGEGDRLVLFTDGVTEAQNAAGDLWGEEPLLALLSETADRSCAETVARIVAEARGFEGTCGASDDVTLIVARRNS
ncbi:MAG: PP2C family protein-serine/threonine phosphatase [Candidatus Eisenbacteria bacterium]|nr:PP2C family protein-serine/threonine phosphatase [Candidatus Eisenbacteria bacterium]